MVKMPRGRKLSPPRRGSIFYKETELLNDTPNSFILVGLSESKFSIYTIISHEYSMTIVEFFHLANQLFTYKIRFLN
jgi:hypothetical protein